MRRCLRRLAHEIWQSFVILGLALAGERPPAPLSPPPRAHPERLPRPGVPPADEEEAAIDAAFWEQVRPLLPAPRASRR